MFIQRLKENGFIAWLVAALLIMLLGFLTGCSTTPTNTRVYEVSTIDQVKGYEAALQPTTYALPPLETDYVGMNRDEKEAAMVVAYLEAQSQVNSCNMDKATVKRIIERVNQLIAAHNEAQLKRAAERTSTVSTKESP